MCLLRGTDWHVKWNILRYVLMVVRYGERMRPKCRILWTDGIKRYSKGLPQQAQVAQGVPIRLTPRIFLAFGTTRMVSRQPYAPAAFTPEEISGTHF
jgi:hypothetical protein